MNIVVLGPGAIGVLWACYFKQAGHHVNVWSRDWIEDSRHYLLTPPDSDALLCGPFTHNRIDALAQADVIFVATKAHQIAGALQPLRAHIHTDTIILFMHNGMGTLDDVIDDLAAYPLLRASTSHAALKHDSHHVQHTGVGQTMLGPLNSQGHACQFMTDVLNHALPNVHWHENIEQPLWRKLAINCVINPLTAIENINNGALLADDYRTRILGIVGEVAAVMQACGQPTTSEQLLDDVYTVIQQTKHNYSSMHQDIAQQRRSEIDFINGYVMRQAQQYAIATPYNTQLWHTIKQLEHSGSSL